MKSKILNIFLFFLFFLFFNCNNLKADNNINRNKQIDNLNIVNKNNFDILATVNEIAITKYDLNMFLSIINYSNKNFINKNNNKIYKEALGNLIDIYKRRIIAEINNIKFEEKVSLWDLFSMNFNTTLSIDEFCKKNNIDKVFLLYFLESNYLWLKFIENNLKQNIIVTDKSVDEVIEFLNKDNTSYRYNLSEIALYYSNKEQKAPVLKRINDIYKSLDLNNFDLMAFSISQSASAKNNGLIGWLSSDDLNFNIINEIGKLNKNDISKPFCIGEESGTCFIFKLNDKEKNIKVLDEDRMKVKNYIFNKTLEEKIKNILNTDNINIVYK